EQTIHVGESCLPETINVVNGGTDALDYTITSDAEWLGVESAAGQSYGPPANPHAVLLACEGLLPGDHQGTLAVTAPGAYGSPEDGEVLIHVETAPSDFDFDGDVDLDDFGFYQICRGASGVAVTGDCRLADLDGDADVDNQDLDIFKRCFDYSGPGVFAP